MRRIFGFLVGIFVGCLVGSGVALLLAPSAGEDLRGHIHARTTGFADEIKSAADARRVALEEHLAALRAPRTSSNEPQQPSE